MNEQSPELKAAIQQILDAMKKRDVEVDALLKKTADDVASFGKIQEGTKEGIASVTKVGQDLHGRLHDIEQKVATLETASAANARPLTPGEALVKDKGVIEFARR